MRKSNLDVEPFYFLIASVFLLQHFCLSRVAQQVESLCNIEEDLPLIAKKLCKLSKHNDFKIIANGVRMGDLGTILLFSNSFMETFSGKAKNFLSILCL